ncbi:DNA repair protein Rad4 [Blumeria hordei DH14]|uniref:DNA repair protein Rad4 n=1 Tax=Blumeria graminis f. sp. hordei (strain DH14) TaxID=546991 RepID=N1J9W5_BLUG1|nr:DNA repair protein Rad4 [Blumeria hordei DH14]
MPPFLPGKPNPLAAVVTSSNHPKTAKKNSKANSQKPTLFDELDAGVRKKTTPDSKNAQKALLERLAASDDDESSLTSLSDDSDKVSICVEKESQAGSDADDEDEDIEFEEVETSAATKPSYLIPTGDLELTLTKDTRISITNPLGNKKAPSKIERMIRISTHKCHVQTLMWNNAIRNGWLCDNEVQDILLEQLPPAVLNQIKIWRQNSETTSQAHSSNLKKKETKPSRTRTSKSRAKETLTQSPEKSVKDHTSLNPEDPLPRLLKVLVKYWQHYFRISSPGLRKVGYKSLQRLDEELKSFTDNIDHEIHGERFQDINEYKEQAKKLEGSRDFGAQLFTALLRAIGLEVRMVSSLQPLGFGWSQNEEASENNPCALKEKGRESLEKLGPDLSSSSSSNSQVVNEPKNKRGEKKSDPHAIVKNPKLLKRSSKRKSDKKNTNDYSDLDLSDSSFIVEADDVAPENKMIQHSLPYDKDLKYPNYWSEVYSPVTKTYIAVDAIVNQVVATKRELLEKFEPRGAGSEKAKQVIAYVIGHSSDGSAKDLTTRYLKGKMWPGRTKGYRYPVEKIAVRDDRGKLERYDYKDWFRSVMLLYERGGKKYPRTEIDEYEDANDLSPAKREKKEVEEGKETLQYYKTSSEFVLERHLKREEALARTAKHVKIFTSGKNEKMVKEKVYLRKDVVICKSTETWHKEGRVPRVDEKPMKSVPYRAATTNRKRELAEAEQASGEKVLQGLYCHSQTDWIIPPPVENGVVPKNSYGNIDLFVESMLPKGSVHIPLRGIPRICRRLEIDYAEAVTGFEFGHRMAVPVITGVVVPENFHDKIMEEWHRFEAERIRKDDEKRRQATLHTWRKMLISLRVIQRFKKEYGGIDNDSDALNPFTNQKNNIYMNNDTGAKAGHISQHEESSAGGFLIEETCSEQAKMRSRVGHFPVICEDEVLANNENEHFFLEESTENSPSLASKTSLKHPQNKKFPNNSDISNTQNQDDTKTESASIIDSSLRSQKTKKNSGQKRRISDLKDTSADEDSLVASTYKGDNYCPSSKKPKIIKEKGKIFHPRGRCQQEKPRKNKDSSQVALFRGKCKQ